MSPSALPQGQIQKGQIQRPPKKSRAIATLAAALVVGFVLATLIASSRGRGSGPVVPCASRVVGIQLSSSDRTAARRELIIDTLQAVVLSAAACARPSGAYGVSGGGSVAPILTDVTAADLTPIGPNEKVRRSRLTVEDKRQARELLTQRLDKAYQSIDGATSSVAAIYRVVGEHAGPGTQVVLITDGVNSDDTVNLNRPLGKGEGQRLAESVEVAEIGNVKTTIVGIAQVDSRLAVPGPSWSTEVFAFNKALCKKSKADKCRLFSTASVQELLG